MNIQILCELEDDPIVISGDGERVKIPESNSTDTIDLDDSWTLSVRTETETIFLKLSRYGQCNIDQIRTLCTNKILSILENGDYLDPSDNDDKFIIYDISADTELDMISVFIEELDKSGEILFGLENSDSIISNLITYERKRISKIKK